uniref:Uncharacterized protein n=1 Tax=Anguilla anguilla TaxID=7936 RepID=A0A0E9TJY0_ANGAN
MKKRVVSIVEADPPAPTTRSSTTPGSTPKGTKR